MKSWIKTSLVATLAASALFSGSALAGCDGHGWGHGWSHVQNANPEQARERMNKRMELHLAQLELALALTPEQKPAWEDFKKAAEARADAMLKEMEKWRNAGEPKTAIERLGRAEESSKMHTAMLADMRKSVEAFYGKLNEAQKTVFDAEAATCMHFRYEGKPGHGHKAGKRGKGGKRVKR
jgi:DNA-binding transcriptional regulator PaaX